MKNTEKQVENIVESFKELLKGLDESDDKQFITQTLIVSFTIWGCRNGFEGIGILESSKERFMNLIQRQLQDDEN
jgi:hypothetical protein